MPETDIAPAYGTLAQIVMLHSRIILHLPVLTAMNTQNRGQILVTPTSKATFMKAPLATGVIRQEAVNPMRMSSKEIGLILLGVLALHTTSRAGAKRKFAVSYVSGTTFYIDAGRLQGLASGDTAQIIHANIKIATAMITAVADSSSALRAISQSQNVSIGDTAVVLVEGMGTQSDFATHDTTIIPVSVEVLSSSKKSPRENVLSGRAAIQYYFISAEDSKFNLNQPAGTVMLNVSNLLGTGMILSLDDHSYYDGMNNYSLYGNPSGFQHNLYQLSLTHDLPESPIGYGIGRMTSRFVGGIGTFDGAQLFYRVDNFTAGILGGAAADVPSSLNFGGTRSAFFLNYHSGKDFFHQYDGTIAYGLQMVGGKLDRNFLYAQNSLSLGTQLYLYETTEIDMSQLSNGARQTAFNFSDTYFSANYYPTNWLLANVGYDASRDIYLFQSMKNIPDSLIDRNILQGYRASVTVHLPGMITASANATLNTRSDFLRDEHTLGGSVRASDIFDADINAGVRYLGMVGVFTNGHDFSVDIDRTFFDRISTTFRYDSYVISISTLQQTYTTQTISGLLYYDFSSRLYSSIEVDDIIDATMNSINASAEIGFRF
jgi:hypothetical protein